MREGMDTYRRLVGAGVASFVLATAVVAAQQPKRPTLKLTARPPLATSPARVVLTADINGGPNDSEDFYCPTIEWDWGDGTMSESSSDCEPYEAGKSEIKRRYSIVHIFQAGNHRVVLRLKKRDKLVTSATAVIDVRPGGNDF
jgi:hypothetical protein